MEEWKGVAPAIDRPNGRRRPGHFSCSAFFVGRGLLYNHSWVRSSMRFSWDTPSKSAPLDASFDQLSSRVGSKPIGTCTDQYITYSRFSEVGDSQVRQISIEYLSTRFVLLVQCPKKRITIPSRELGAQISVPIRRQEWSEEGAWLQNQPTDTQLDWNRKLVDQAILRHYLFLPIAFNLTQIPCRRNISTTQVVGPS
jgi:hypothetical protein